MRVHCSRVNDTFVTPYIVKQAVTRLDTTASLHQRAQKFKFKAGEIDPLAVDRDFITRRINGDGAGCQAFIVVVSPRRGA